MTSTPDAKPIATLPPDLARQAYAQARAGAGGAEGANTSFASQLGQVARTANKATSKPADPAQIDKTARDFEAMFLSSMLQPIFAGVHSEKGMFGGGHAEESYSAMMVDEYAKAIAKRGGLGIADSVKRQILAMQEVKTS